jgi:hypothetical protein
MLSSKELTGYCRQNCDTRMVHVSRSNFLICFLSRAMSISCILRLLTSDAKWGTGPSMAEVKVACAAFSAGGTRMPNHRRGVVGFEVAPDEALFASTGSVAVVVAETPGGFSKDSLWPPAFAAPGMPKSGAETRKPTLVSVTVKVLFSSAESFRK